MKNIRIEKVGDIHSDYPYLEVFFKENKNPFLEISITKEKQLSFKIYAHEKDISLNVEDLKYIFSSSKSFLPQALKDENDYLNFKNS